MRRLAARLGAPAVLTRYSRLLIDCNRGLDDPTLIMRLSDGAIVPANRHIDAAERERRIARYYTPYHAAIERLIDAALALGVPPLLLSVHSFTDKWRGRPRPWHAGVLWDKDPRLAQRLIAALAQGPGMIVGDNEPYSGSLRGDSMWRHGTERGLPHAIVEIRQDLIAGEEGQQQWGERLAGVLAGPPCARGRRARPETAASLRLAHAIDAAHRLRRGKGVTHMDKIDARTQIELEAAAFRRLLAHLRERTDVQNIDLMNLAGFCRNCLANWYQEAAAERGTALSKDEARQIIYGMPYREWQQRYQTEASPEAQAAFAEASKKEH